MPRSGRLSTRNLWYQDRQNRRNQSDWGNNRKAAPAHLGCKAALEEKWCEVINGYGQVQILHHLVGDQMISAEHLILPQAPIEYSTDSWFDVPWNRLR